MKKTLIILIFFSIAPSHTTFAEIWLPPLFCDNMVMQQQTLASIWGKATRNASVTVITSWNQKSYNTKASATGTWSLNVATPRAGGPYEITISDEKTIKLKNILIGEVWICSGQSNMEMPLKGYVNQPVIGSAESIALSNNQEIRLFTVNRTASLEPLNDFKGNWNLCEPENVADFSATAYYFGLMLHRALHVPVGLISANWGGSRIEAWIGESGYKNLNWINLPQKNANGKFAPRATPTVLFNAMINPMVGYAMRGVIWYQGEENHNEPQEYAKLLPALIQNWRDVWAIGDFPFYYVQIAPYDYGPYGLNTAYFREAQLKASAALPNIGMVCIMDLGEKNCIHPAAKEPGSKRLALLALGHTYGMKGINYLSPVLKEMTVNESVVKLSFDNAPNGLTSFGKELSCFEVAGENKRFYPANASILNDGIVLFSSQVSKPVAVRYAFKDFIIGDLFSTEGLPVSSFRTDNWPPPK